MADLVAKVRRFREVDNIAFGSAAEVPELLETVSTFLQGHETSASGAECTHAVFDNFPDWWQSLRPTYKLAIVEDSAIDLLYEHIGALYDLGIPLTLTEKRTPAFRFFQDIEIWGAKGANAALPVAPSDLLASQGTFTRLLGEAMGKVFPELPELDVAILDSSGLSREKNMMETSVRLVWPGVVVDRDRASKIRDFIVHKIQESQDEELRRLQDRLREEFWNNEWRTIFIDGMQKGRDGVRMPLNDRTSPAPFKKPEQRPFVPLAVLRFSYREGALTDIEPIATHDLSNADWLKISCIRQHEGTPLTEWVEPRWWGGWGRHDWTGGGSGYAGGASKASIRLQTQNPSPGSVDPRHPRHPKQRGQVAAEEPAPSRVEREFYGGTADFRACLEKELGRLDEQSVQQDDNMFVWTQPNEGAKIEYRADTRRVSVVGRSHQMRSLLNLIVGFVHPVSGELHHAAAPAATSARSAASAPSAAYAPRAAAAPSAAQAASETSQQGAVAAGGCAAGVSSRRVAISDFMAETSNELSFTAGDCVEMTQDPKAGGQTDMNRWVYGENVRSRQRGWFPLLYTVAQEPSRADASGIAAA